MMVSPNLVNHNTTNQGREGLRAELEYWLSAFSDVSVPVEALIAEGDLVAARHMVIGTHTGEFLGVPATGKHISVQEMDTFRIENGLIAESWSAPDLFGILSQIGALADRAHDLDS
jgi:steroid delta-isomerase-like uncharacterized protein